MAQLPNTWLKTVNSSQLPTVFSFDNPRLLYVCYSTYLTLVSAIGHSKLLDHGCGSAFRPTYDSLPLTLQQFRRALKTYLFG